MSMCIVRTHSPGRRAGHGLDSAPWGHRMGMRLLAALLVALAPAVTAGAAEPPTLLDYPVSGSFIARQASRLGAQVSGRVLEVLVDVGDQVRKDQPLVRLSPTFFQIDVDQSKAALQLAQVSLQDAERNLERMQRLFQRPPGETPAIAEKQYDDAITLHQVAAARLEQARAGLHNAQERLAETVVRAPYDGVITRRMVDPGESVTSAPVTLLVELQEVSTLELEFSLPQSMLANVHKGTPLRYEVPGLAEGKGSARVAIVYPVMDPATRSFRCRAVVDNTALRLQPGMLVEVRVLRNDTSGARQRSAAGTAASD